MPVLLKGKGAGRRPAVQTANGERRTAKAKAKAKEPGPAKFERDANCAWEVRINRRYKGGRQERR